MIEDRELRGLFSAESNEHIESLERIFLRLEKTPDDIPSIDEAMRTAHSLKGSSRMLGLKAIELISHRIEGVFASVKKGELRLGPETIDALCRGLDAVRLLVKEAVSGEPSNVEVSKVIDGLAERQAQKKTAEAGGLAPEPPEEQSAHVPHRETIADVRPEAFKIETIRVDTKKLDEVMTLVGELAVMKTRLSGALSLSSELLELWDANVKGFFRNKTNTDPKNGFAAGFAVLLNALKDRLFEDSSVFENLMAEIDSDVREIRLVPFSAIFGLFPRMVRDIARQAGKEARLLVSGAETVADKRIIEEMKDPIMHMLRNAVDHGIEAPEARQAAGKPREGLITLEARRSGTNIVVEVADDGRGLDLDAVKKAAVKRRLIPEGAANALAIDEAKALIFRPGFSTSRFVTDTSGRGIGLDVVRANIERLKGSVGISSEEGGGLRLIVTLPAALATIRAFIAISEGRYFAVPVEHVVESRLVRGKDVLTIEGRGKILVGSVPVPVEALSALLGFAAKGGKPDERKDGPAPCMVLSAGNAMFGVLVDEILSEQEALLKPQSTLLKRVPNISGSTILGGGQICMVLNPADLFNAIEKGAKPAAGPVPTEEKPKKVLLVEDSITTRTQEKRILEASGYEVTTAVDGLDALSRLQSDRFDAVISDILMPNMDGLALTQRIRQDKRYKDMPVILVTTLASDEDKRRGLLAGADAYIPKPSFDQRMLIDTLRRLA